MYRETNCRILPLEGTRLLSVEVFAGWDGAQEFHEIYFTICKIPQSTLQSKSKTTRWCCSASTEKTYRALLQVKALKSCMSHKHHLLECSISSRDWVFTTCFPLCHDTAALLAHSVFMVFTLLSLRKSSCSVLSCCSCRCFIVLVGGGCAVSMALHPGHWGSPQCLGLGWHKGPNLGHRQTAPVQCQVSSTANSSTCAWTAVCVGRQIHSTTSGASPGNAEGTVKPKVKQY